MQTQISIRAPVDDHVERSRRFIAEACAAVDGSNAALVVDVDDKARPGPRNIVVKNPDCSTATLAGKVKVAAPAPPVVAPTKPPRPRGPKPPNP